MIGGDGAQYTPPGVLTGAYVLTDGHGLASTREGSTTLEHVIWHVTPELPAHAVSALLGGCFASWYGLLAWLGWYVANGVAVEDDA